MPVPTPAYAKNIIRRSLREIIDSSPSEKDKNKLWEFFNSECAYCGRKLDRKAREGHIDHLISSSQGGANHISNRVLSCAKCNEKEKRDMPWQKFLSEKVPNKNRLNARKKKISEWKKKNNSSLSKTDMKLLEVIELKGDDVIKVYDKKVLEVRKLLERTGT